MSGECDTWNEFKKKKLGTSVGTEFMWCSGAHSECCEIRGSNQGKDHLSAKQCLLNDSTPWSLIVHVRNRQRSVCPSVPPCSFKMARSRRKRHIRNFFLLETWPREIIYCPSKWEHRVKKVMGRFCSLFQSRRRTTVRGSLCWYSERTRTESWTYAWGKYELAEKWKF